MAKRAPAGEEPYRPLLDPGVISAALTKPVAARAQEPSLNAKVVELTRSENGPAEVRSGGREAPVARAMPEPPTTRMTTRELVEKLDQEKRMLLTRTESVALDRLVGALASRLNTQVKSSHVLRALLTLLLHAEAAVDRRAGEVVGLSRPANGDFKGIQKFEREIARIVAAALRDAGPLRDSQP
ncbi:MAG: hypothetical protein RLZZ188_1035 [Verrucomicrobiota bacterium]|jgi:hypothetical protein